MSRRKDRLKKRDELHRQIKRRERRMTQLGNGPRLFAGLRKAEELVEGGDLAAADKLLSQLHQEFPQSEDLLRTWCDVCYDTQNSARHELVGEFLHQLVPGDSGVSLMLAGLHLANCHPTLAYTQFGRFLRQFPNHPMAAEAEKTYERLTAAARQIWRDLGEDDEERATKITHLHERTLAAIQRGEPAAARTCAEQLLELKPEFMPAWNNLAESQVQLGLLAEAEQSLRRGLRIDPTNPFAQGSLARVLFLTGQVEEAQRVAAQFAIEADASLDAFIRQAESYLLLGDNEAVLKLLERRQSNASYKGSPDEARLLHLAAVAALRLGREGEAKKLWQQALRLDSDLEIARENLDDLARPLGERNGPWPFATNHWISAEAVSAIKSELDHTLGTRKKQDKTGALLQLFVERQPQLPMVIPVLLEMGDDYGRKLAFTLAKAIDTPEMQAALLNFARSTHGPDRLRFDAANHLYAKEALPSGLIELSVRGERRETRLTAFEIYTEPIATHCPRVEELAKQGIEALHDRDGEVAERLFQAALEIEPDQPVLLNNLAAAWELQGREDEAHELMRQIHARFPDYYFGITGMAQLLIKEGDLEGAERLIKPLFERRRVHLYEYAAFCDTQISLFVAKRNPPAAKSWLDLFEQAFPDHPNVAMWRRRFAARSRRGPLASLFNWAARDEE